MEEKSVCCFLFNVHKKWLHSQRSFNNVGIIGTIAAFTIPTLMHDIQDQQFKTAYKKAFSVASQAWQSAYADNMLESRNSWEMNISNYDNFNQFMSKFDVIKTCTTSNISDCWAPNETSDTMWNIPFDGNSHYVSFIDKSGMAWCNAALWVKIAESCLSFYLKMTIFLDENEREQSCKLLKSLALTSEKGCLN